ncbi:MAG: hypothetical protein S4CHLAM37_11900 [Chlamydiia bacterium]|nr:hypothetical protein [Chlamydiia bacterium]
MDRVEAVGSASGASHKITLGQILTHGKGTVQKYSFAMIVLQVLNKVGLEHQQKIMQLRGQLMDVETRMQNDLTTISTYLSQVESNSHSGGGSCFENNNMRHSEGVLWGPNSYNGLSSSYYNSTFSMITNDSSNEGINPSSFKENASASYVLATNSFVSAVKDLFFASSSATGTTVGDISKIINPRNGKHINMMGVYQKLQNDPQIKGFSVGGAQVISTNKKDAPSLYQQYIFYKAQLGVYTKQLKPKDILAEFTPGASHSDAMLNSFIEDLSALNVKPHVHRDEYNTTDMSMMDTTTQHSVLYYIATGQVKATCDGGTYMHRKYEHDSKHPTVDFRIDQVHPGLMMAMSMMGFNYFWTKNPNASMDQGSSQIVMNGEMDYQDSTEYVGRPSSDPLSALYMTNNSVQTNLSQQSSQSNNNFQSDVNAASQMDNMGVNSIKSFFEGTSTMNRNSRIS